MTTPISNPKKPILNQIPLESAALDRTEQLLKKLKTVEMLPS